MPDPGETPESASVAVYLQDLSLKSIWRQALGRQLSWFDRHPDTKVMGSIPDTRINQWNNKLMFLSLFSLSKIIF